MTATIDKEQAEPTFQPPVRECVHGEPDEVIAPGYPGYRTALNDRKKRLEFQESSTLTEIADGLIERLGSRYEALDKIEIMYLWAEDCGKFAGEMRVLKVQKVTPLVLWALNRDAMRAPRTPDVLVLVNAYLARLGQMTHWQAQAAVHTALEAIRVQDGEARIVNPDSSLIRNYILRRYGAWSSDLQIMAAAMAKAASEQLPLFGEDEDEDEEEGDDDGGE